MGLAKNQAMVESEQGWSFSDDSVCQRCVREPALQLALAAREDPDEVCSFCRTAPAAPMDSLLGPFVEGLRRMYDYAKDTLYWDGREGGYQGPTIDTWDLIDEFSDVLVGPGLAEAVRAAMEDELWVSKDWAVPGREVALAQGWDRFCREVKYETRFVMWRKAKSTDTIDFSEIPPADILDAVGGLVDIYPEYLTHEINDSTLLWRARPHGKETPVSTATDLGTTPVPKSQSNRMSPAGIPMFYGALDPRTAIDEATQNIADPILVTVGAFIPSGTVKLLDLTHVREPPSVFAPDGDERPQWVFLNYFAQSLRQKAPLAEIDYVPTQIVTEYFLKIFGEGDYLEGVMYRSDVPNGGTCVVLNVRNEACVEPLKGWNGDTSLKVALVSGTLVTQQVRDVPPVERA